MASLDPGHLANSLLLLLSRARKRGAQVGWGKYPTLSMLGWEGQYLAWRAVSLDPQLATPLQLEVPQ